MIGRHLLYLAALGLAGPAMAQETTAVDDLITLPAGTLESSSGRVAVNVASGDGNQQAGAALLSLGAVAAGTLELHQIIPVAVPVGERSAAIVVGSDSIVGNTGLISFNASAGTANQSANLAILNVSETGALSDLQLSQARAPTEPSGSNSPGIADSEQSVSIASDAFSGNAGLVQINLTGGEANTSANTFMLNVSAGGPPQP